MLKLLTEEGREKVVREYSARRGIVVFLALILVLVIGVIGLMPAYILSDLREREALDRSQTIVTNDAMERGAELKTWLVEVNRRLLLLAPALDTDRPSSFVEEILDLKLSGIKITAISWLKAKDKITLSVGGVALDRQTLVRFEDKVASSELFAGVTLPISDLAKDRDINFQIKFSPK